MFRRTKLSKTHLLSFHSAGRHCQSCWFRLSRHSQCLRNSVKQCVLISVSLCCPPKTSVPLLQEQATRTIAHFPGIGNPSPMQKNIMDLARRQRKKRTRSGRSGLPFVPPSSSSALPCRGSRSCTACNHRCSRGIGHR